MANSVIVVKAAWDAEASVWYVENSDVPGLNVESESLEALVAKLPAAVLDLIEAGALDDGITGDLDVPIELVAHASTRVQRTAA